MKALEIIGKSILIIGSPASGKTFLSDKMESMGFKVIHTDDYIQYGYVNSLYNLLKDIDEADLKNTVIEGVLGYRLLRKGTDLGTYRPDFVIELKPPIDVILSRYKTERDASKIKSVMSMIKANETVLNQYHQTVKNKPEWITLEDSEVLFA